MKRKTRIPVCHESLRPLYERAVREGRIAMPDDVSMQIAEVEEQWKAQQKSSTAPPADARGLRDLLRRYCQTTGIAELTAHARRIKGRIDVEVTESR